MLLSTIIQQMSEGKMKPKLLLSRGLALAYSSGEGGRHFINMSRVGVAPSEEEVQIVWGAVEKLGAVDIVVGKVEFIDRWTCRKLSYSIEPAKQRPLIDIPTTGGAHATL